MGNGSSKPEDQFADKWEDDFIFLNSEDDDKDDKDIPEEIGACEGYMSDVRHIWNRIFETDWEVKEAPDDIMEELMANIGAKVENDLKETRRRVGKVMEHPQSSPKAKLFCPKGPGKCKALTGAPDSLAFAVGAYTGPDIYKHVNFALRNKQFDKFPVFLKHLVAALRYLPYDDSKELYRGLGKKASKSGSKRWTIEDFKEGSLVAWYGFTSMTQSKKVAQYFAGKKGLIVKLKAQTGRDISALSPFDEKEVLLPPLTVIQITRVRQEKENIVVDAQEIQIWKGKHCVLWIDDHPENNKVVMQSAEFEAQTNFAMARSTKAAVAFFEYGSNVDLKHQPLSAFRIVTDMYRDTEPQESAKIAGAIVIKRLREIGYKETIMVYVSDIEHTQKHLAEAGVDLGGVIVTNQSQYVEKWCSFKEMG